MDRWEINRTAIKCYMPREEVHFGTLGRLKWHPKNDQNASIIRKRLNRLFKIHIRPKDSIGCNFLTVASLPSGV